MIAGRRSAPQPRPDRARARAARTSVARTAAAIIATASLALTAAAYGSARPSSTGAGGSLNARASALSRSTNTQKALAYSRCMRAHGVLKFPDPGSSGAIPKEGLQQLGVSSTVFETAQNACRRLLPNSGQSSQAWDQMMMTALWKFARCVRAHGVPNWPDPLAESDPGQPGTPGFPRNLPPSINANSPVVKGAMHTCQHLIPGYASGGYP
jgi:hypothetical protein